MSEGHRVIAQDTVTSAIGHFYVRGLDNINFTFTLYCAEEAVWRSKADSREKTTKTEAPKKEINKNILFLEVSLKFSNGSRIHILIIFLI